MLLALAERAARGKRRHPEIARFLLDPWPRLGVLERELCDRTYRPGAPRRFSIHEPKRRLISALPFRDRIVQHFLIDRMQPALERWFAPQSYACRVGYGTHRALRRAVELQRTHPWLLRLDVAKFFPSIDHERLLELFLPRCPHDLYWLVRRILEAPSHVEPVPHGEPVLARHLPHPLDEPQGDGLHAQGHHRGITAAAPPPRRASRGGRRGGRGIAGGSAPGPPVFRLAARSHVPTRHAS